MSDAANITKTALVVGASRSLGLGLVAEYLERGWSVIGTVRGADRTPLHALAESSDGRLSIERVDITEPDQLVALRERLGGTRLDLLFINAGVTNADEPAADVTTEEFTRVMVTNALSPLRAIDHLGALVGPGGTIGVMTSRQGSISMNTRGGHDVYRASKSALNSMMRSYAAAHADGPTLLLMHPGWVQTELGGEGAQLSVAESVAGIASTIGAHASDGGLQFLDYRGETVAW